jgi:phosphate starvation-inducible PhoH-like protein
MGKIKVGDYVISRNGKPTKVIGVYPKGYKDVFKVTTTDGTSTECCEDHLWYTYTAEDWKRKRNGSVKSTKQILNTLYKSKLFCKQKQLSNHRLPRNEAIYFDKKEVPVDPYLLGALIGDGSLVKNIYFSNTDIELINRVNLIINQLGGSLIHYKDTITYNVAFYPKNNKVARPLRSLNLDTGETVIYNTIGEAIEKTGIDRGTLNRACKTNKPIKNILYQFMSVEIDFTNKLKNDIHNLGLLGLKADDKFIPDLYLYNDINTRLEILRGLMDTDGTVKKNGEASFCTTSLKLATNVIELVRSLGGRATLVNRDRRDKKHKIKNREIITKLISYEFTISLPNEMNPFFISRKAKWFKTKYIHGSWIRSIDLIGSKEVQCIKVENKEHLYITDDYIVTHNTLEEKFLPFLSNYFDNFEHLVPDRMRSGSDGYDFILKRYNIECKPIALIRGASWSNAFIVADEVQALSPFEMLTLGTRTSENSKLVLLGDLKQIDGYLKIKDSGLFKFVNNEQVKTSPIAASIHMLKSERGKVSTLFSSVFEEDDEG